MSVGERDGIATVSIRRTGDLSNTVTVDIGITADTATEGVDYIGAPIFQTVTFAPGQDVLTISRSIIDDALSEATETFVVSLISADGVGASLGAPRTVRVDILDDENPVTDPPDPPLVSPYEVSLNDIMSGLTTPIAFEFLESDPTKLFIAEKRGMINVYDASALATGGAPVFESTLLDIRSIVNDRQDRGLIDIAIHPDLENSPYLYAFYVVDPPGAGLDGAGNRFSHLVRYTLDESTGYTSIINNSASVILGGGAQTIEDISGRGDLDFTNPAFADRLASDIDVARNANGVATEPYDVSDPPFVQDMLKVDSRSHAGGALAFGPDGALYVSVGDGTSYNYADPHSFYVQDVDSLVGKILRINPITGSGLADNPFVGGTDLAENRSKVWQLGLRNPFAMDFDEDGRLFISEVGWAKWEEINTGGAGANFGWPFYEGGDNGVLSLNPAYNSHPLVLDGTFTAPSEAQITAAFRAFSHTRADPGYQFQAIVGGEFISSSGPDSPYPAALDGHYLFADFEGGGIFAIDPDDRRDITFLFERAPAPVRYEQGPDGYLYYADVAGGFFGRIEIERPALPTLEIVAPADTLEGAAGETKALVFSVVLSQAAGPGGVTADVLVTGGGAVTPASLVIAQGQTTATISVQVVGDNIVEPDETVTVTLSNLRNATGAGVSASAQILDDDDSALRLTGAATYNPTNNEFVLTTAARNLIGGAATSYRIDLRQDVDISFDMLLGTSDAGGDGLGLALHADPRGAAALGAGGGKLGLGGLANAVAIRFDTLAGAGEPASDYTSIYDPDSAFTTTRTPLANLENGVWRQVDVTWDVGNALSYSIDGVQVGSLAASTVAGLFGGASFGHVLFAAATGAKFNRHSIRDVEIDTTPGQLPTLQIAAPADTLEGAAGETKALVFSVVLSQAAGPGGVTADVLVTGGGAVTPASLVIAQGQTTATISVQVVGDNIVEPDETVTVTLSNLRNATGAGVSASAQILDDDVAPPQPLGAATYNPTNNEFVLTTAARNLIGGAVTSYRIDLRQDVDISFDMLLGTSDAGGDGLGLALHADPRGAAALGAGGGKLGLGGLANAVAIRFDTLAGAGEPASDYTSIYDPDSAFTTTRTPLANLENGVWRQVDVTWDVGNALSYSIDGVQVGSLAASTVAGLFGGASFGHVLFAAATGAKFNRHSIRDVEINATPENAALARTASDEDHPGHSSTDDWFLF